MGSLDVDVYLPVGPQFKTVVVVGRPGRYGWSKRLRPGANCVVGRWEGGDQISDWELGWYLGQFVRAGKITRAQRSEFYGVIRKLDEGKGGTEDLPSIRAFAKVLGMRVIVKASEPPLPKVKPGPYSMSYKQAYRLAAFLRRDTQGLEVRVRKADKENQRSPMASWWRLSPGSYTVSVRPSVMGN